MMAGVSYWPLSFVTLGHDSLRCLIPRDKALFVITLNMNGGCVFTMF